MNVRCWNKGENDGRSDSETIRTIVSASDQIASVRSHIDRVTPQSQENELCLEPCRLQPLQGVRRPSTDPERITPKLKDNAVCLAVFEVPGSSHPFFFPFTICY